MALLALASCSGKDDDGERDGDGGVDERSSGGKLPAEAPACLVTEVSAEIAVGAVDKVDLLFVVDDSASMSEEQVALAAQFPTLIKTLTTGDRNGDGDSDDESDFAPAPDLHLGVVSSDLGLPGTSEVPGCSGLGDDGILLHAPSLANCQTDYPPFLSYRAGVMDPDQVAGDFACIATLGTSGCGFGQPLESALKALWPAIDPMPQPNGMNRISFLGNPDGSGRLGHGDVENDGFLRNDPQAGLSLIAVIVVSDDEDCSIIDGAHLRPAAQLDPRNPADAQLLMQGMGVRCHFSPDKLFSVDRYLKGLQALRPENESLVVFGAIAGVPPETVDQQALSDTDFDDTVARNAFYDRILAHRSMQPVVDDHGTPEVADDTMSASCVTESGSAYPPRRIVQVAQSFGRNGIVQSICNADFGPAMDAITTTIAKQLGAPCLPRPLVRGSNGLVGCELSWELPPAGEAGSGTPIECETPGFEFLLPPAEGHPRMASRGGQICRVAQLAVRDGATLTTEVDGTDFDEGWYYDDFSASVQRGCTTTPKQGVAFTQGAKPPPGVSVRLQCSHQQPIVIDDRTDVVPFDQPRLGSACAEVLRDGQTLSGDAACAVRLADGQVDGRMFCHPETLSCVQACDSKVDCPPDWVCTDDPELIAASERRYCVAPTCGLSMQSAKDENVGSPCLTDAIPAGGFQGTQAYVQTSSPFCDGGVCLVHGLDGDPSADCASNPERSCASSRDVERSVYCSCRCDAPNGSPECECPDGFSCVTELLQSGDASGGYCVRNDAFAR